MSNYIKNLRHQFFGFGFANEPLEKLYCSKILDPSQLKKGTPMGMCALKKLEIKRSTNSEFSLLNHSSHDSSSERTT
jgi:hypothetical protein